MAYPEFKSPLIYMWQYLNRSVFDFIRGSRKYIVIPAPTVVGETVKVYLSAPETVLKFEGDMLVDFNLEVIPVNAKLGDKLYMTFSATVGGAIITPVGQLGFNECGPSVLSTNLTVSQGTTVIPFLYVGTSFYGMDYC